MASLTIYIFGNPLLDFDNLPLLLLGELKKIFPQYNFIVADPQENLKPQNKELIIIDTVLGIEKAKIFNRLDAFENSPRYSLHDFDLVFNLKLLQKIGQLKKVAILGIPPHLDKKTALEQLVPLLQGLAA